MKNQTLWRLITILASVGILLALYLMYNFMAYRGIIFSSPSEICNINPSINCSPVTSGNLSTWFGVPVSVVGLIGYIVILIGSLRKMKKTTLFMTAFGMFFCLRLTILELFVEHIVCPVCTMCQLIMATVFILSIVIMVRDRKPKTAETE